MAWALSALKGCRVAPLLQEITSLDASKSTAISVWVLPFQAQWCSYVPPVLMPKHCICVLRMVLTANGNCFPKQHYPVGFCSGDVMCFL
jgi:hypothetical protein